MWKYISSFLYPEPKVYELEPDPVFVRCDGKNNEEEKIPNEEEEIVRDPYPILEIIVNNKYLKREIGYFFNWENVTVERLSALNKSFDYWIAFVNVSSLYLNTPKINYKTKVYYVEFWENYYKNS